MKKLDRYTDNIKSIDTGLYFICKETNNCFFRKLFYNLRMHECSQYTNNPVY